MILLPDLRTLIITPPKTASRSLGKVFCGLPPYGGQLVIGPSMDGRVDHHTALIPAGKDGYRVLASVRHPLDRLVSLWCHLVDEDKRHGRATMAFYIFAAHVGRRDLGTIAADPFFGWNLCDHLQNAAEPRLVKYETLCEDLAAAELPIDGLPWLGKTSGRDKWPQYYDAATLAVVEEWARPDCERFGYEWPSSVDALGRTFEPRTY
jgi:hypothetical protein